MLIASNFVDEARRFVSELDSVWLWSVSLLSLAYAIFDTKDTWDEIKAAKRFRKFLPGLKMLLLWTIPIVGVLGAWSAEVNSKLAQDELRQFNVKLEAMRGENAKLFAVGERAKESAERAREEAEKARKEREIAESGRIALQTKLVELEIKAGRRHLTEQQAAFIENSLVGVPRGKIRIVTTALGDDESGKYRTELAEFFSKRLGYEVEQPPDTMVFSFPEFFGIAMGVESPNKVPPFAIPIRSAFKEAGAADIGGYIAPEAIDMIVIKVGKKPPY